MFATAVGSMYRTRFGSRFVTVRSLAAVSADGEWLATVNARSAATLDGNGIAVSLEAMMRSRSLSSSSNRGRMPSGPIETAMTFSPTRTTARAVLGPIDTRCTTSTAIRARGRTEITPYRFANHTATHTRASTNDSADKMVMDCCSIKLSASGRTGVETVQRTIHAANDAAGALARMRVMRTPKCSPSTTTSPSANRRSPT